MDRERSDGTFERLNEDPIVGQGTLGFLDKKPTSDPTRYWLNVVRVGEAPLLLGTVEVRGLSAVLVTSFVATRVRTSVHVNWKATDPDGRAAYHVLRELDGVRTRRTIRPIGETRFVDSDAPPGAALYFLEVWIDGVLGEVIGPEALSPLVEPFEIRAVPNPAPGPVRLLFSLDRATEVRVEIYDPSGRLVARILDEAKSRGLHELLWDPSSAAMGSGVYWVKLVSHERESASRFLWIRR